MGILSVKLLQEEPNLKSFSCGVSSIDQMVQNAFLNHILFKTRCFEIKYGDAVVGYYQLSFCKINAEDSTLCTEGYGNDNFYGALKIDFIAIRKEFQHTHIGTFILTRIIKEANTLRVLWPVRVVCIEALYERVKWYTDNGFATLHPQTYPEEYGTVKMIFDLMSEQEKSTLDDYCNRMIE